MHTKIISKSEFISLFNLSKDVSFDEFSRKLSVVKYTNMDGSEVDTLDEYILRNNSKDRMSRLLEYKKVLYKIIVEEPEIALGWWFDRYGNLPEDISYYFQFPDTPIRNKNVFNGKTNYKYGKFCRAANFKVAHNTLRTNIGNHARRETIKDLRLMFEEFVLNYNLPTPSFFDLILNLEDMGGYKELWKKLMMFLNKPSILNPYLYRGVLTELFDGDTLFAPCMSWNACQLAFYNSQFSHFISTDVIPSVVENGHNLHMDWEDYNKNGVLFPDKKSIDLYLCPSEQLQNRHQFIDKYRNSVDAVLFCPPYFDLELYDGGEQSVESFPDYFDWLRGYWEETVKTCVEVMRPGARFGFIISDYYHDCGKTLVPISENMSHIVGKHLHLINKYHVQWGSFITKKGPEKMKEGNFEDLWLFEKR